MNVLDYLFHIRGDTSKMENKKKVTVVHQLMNEKQIKKSIVNWTGDNVHESDTEHADADIDGNVVMTADV